MSPGLWFGVSVAGYLLLASITVVICAHIDDLADDKGLANLLFWTWPLVTVVGVCWVIYQVCNIIGEAPAAIARAFGPAPGEVVEAQESSDQTQVPATKILI